MYKSNVTSMRLLDESHTAPKFGFRLFLLGPKIRPPGGLKNGPQLSVTRSSHWSLCRSTLAPSCASARMGEAARGARTHCFGGRGKLAAHRTRSAHGLSASQPHFTARSAPLVRPAARLLVVPRWLYLGQRTSEVRWPTRTPTCDHEGRKVQEPS